MATKQNFEITGIIKQIGEREVKSEKLTIRNLTLEIEDGNYKTYPSFQFKNDRADLLDMKTEGEEVKVAFNVTGREWQGLFFTSLEGWKITVIGSAPPAKKQVEPVAESAGEDVPTGDLPF